MNKIDIMEEVFQTLFNMDSDEFMKSLEKCDISKITDFLFEMQKPVDSEDNKLTLSIIKPRKPEYIEIVHPGMHVTI